MENIIVYALYVILSIAASIGFPVILMGIDVEINKGGGDYKSLNMVMICYALMVIVIVMLGIKIVQDIL